MFKELLGIPAHALILHAAVIFVPLLVLFAIMYAVLPGLRTRIGWVAAILAVVGPVSTYFAKESGEELRTVLIAKQYPSEIINKVNEHEAYGSALFWYTLGLGVATGLLLFLTGRRRHARRVPAVVAVVLAGIVVVLGVVTAGYVFLTGDSGAHAVWQGVL